MNSELSRALSSFVYPLFVGQGFQSVGQDFQSIRLKAPCETESCRGTWGYTDTRYGSLGSIAPRRVGLIC